MSDKIAYTSVYANNHAHISGRLETRFVYSHKTMLERYYHTRVKVNRISENTDYIPVIVSEQLVYNFLSKDVTDKYVEVIGTLRSFNAKKDNGGYRLDIFLFASDFIMYSDEDQNPKYDKNSIFLEGYVGRVPQYRVTPFGREITDLMLGINSNYDRSYYIPCITWGRTATYCAHFQMGDKVQLWGRIQSRNYTKMLDDATSEVRTTYEVSAYSVTQVFDDK